MTIAVALALLLSAPGRLLEIGVVAGEGAVHPAGSKSSPGLVVRVTDELGSPIPGVVVSFRLPDDGPGGAFASGLATEIATTGPDGRAVAPPVRWNQVHGALEIRITAAKDGIRAGAVVLQHIAERPAGERRLRPGRKWLYIAVIAGGGAVAAVAGTRAGGGAGTPTGASPVDVEIGPPTVIIGKP